MTVRTSPWPNGVPCWVDVTCSDLERSRAFYSAVLGWGYHDTDSQDTDSRDTDSAYGGYVIAHLGGHAIAGLGPAMPEVPPAWTLYFANDDAAAGAAAIRAAGGQVLIEPQEVGDQGRFVMAVDPTGAMFGLWEADRMNGCQLVNEAGGLTWEDLRSPEPEAARDFYRSVLGIETTPLDMAGPDYHTFALPGSPAPLGGMGGLMGEAAGARAHWLVYFAVADAGAALQAAEQTGGQVTAPAFETPFGRMAGLSDPDGSEFWVVQAPEDQPRPEWQS